MTTIKCECGNKISINFKNCPYCGCEIDYKEIEAKQHIKQQQLEGKIYLYVICFFVILFALVFFWAVLG